MLQEGFQFINSAPWALVFPGLAIMFTVLSFNLVADGLRDSLGRERPAGSGLVGGDPPIGVDWPASVAVVGPGRRRCPRPRALLSWRSAACGSNS